MFEIDQIQNPFGNLKHIRDIKHITHTPFQTRISKENQAIVFEHVKQKTCISQNVSFFTEKLLLALCKYTWLK